jgi:multiple sugar transport system substrate-binding protein
MFDSMLLQQGYLHKKSMEALWGVEINNPHENHLVWLGKGRPNIPEYPIVAEHIRNAIEQVYNGMDPKQALDEASKQSAKALGW